MAQQAGVIKVLDAPVAAGHAAGVLARLAEREEERAAATARRLEELQVSADPRESVDAFLQDFAGKRQQLEVALQAAAGTAGSGGAAGGSGDAAAELAALAGQIAKLEQAVADATYFLPAYDCWQATLALGALREQQEAAAAALQPRKKFSFNRRAPAAGAKAPAAVAGCMADSSVTQIEPSAVAAAASSTSSSQLPQTDEQDPQQQQQQDQQQPSSGDKAASASARGGSTIRGLRGQVLAPSREEVAGQEFTLSDLEDCTVFLLAPLAALFMHGLRRCRIYSGPVAGACFVEGAQECVLTIAARQVRIHAAHASDFYLRVRSHPIIEHSSGLRFAPYACCYPGCPADLEGQGLEPDSGMWRQVNDFGWLRATPSPHWSEMPEAERQAPAQAPGEEAAPAEAASGGADGGSSAAAS